MSIISPAAAAMTNAMTRFERASQTLVHSGASDVDAVESIVEIIEAKHQFKAGVATVRIADEMLAELLKLNERA